MRGKHLLTSLLEFSLKVALVVSLAAWGYSRYAYIKELEDLVVQQSIALAKFTKPTVEAQTMRATGDVIVRLYKDDNNLHYFPGLCPKGYVL